MNSDKNKQLRSDFKMRHFGMDDLGTLFSTYQATRAFYKNTTNNGTRVKFPNDIINDKLGLSPESLCFYTVYEHEVLNKLKADKPFIPLIELQVCGDLVEMEYMLNSDEFNVAFNNMDRALLKKVKRTQHEHSKQGIPNYLSASQIGCGEACFALFLHPEFVDTVTCMMKDFKLPQPVQITLEKAQKFQRYMLENQMLAQQLSE